MRERLKMQAYGVGFVLVLILLLGLAVATYQKRFTPVAKVTLITDFSGNRLLPDADVKVKGIVVGSVATIKATTTGASIALHLDPSKLDLIPTNAQAQLLPKTLFGEEYVALILPAAPVGKISGGDTIHQDTSAQAAQVSDLLRNVQPVLNALNPAELNATLTAVATALRGRGDQIGQSLVDLDTYLKQLNPSMPQAVNDLVNFSKVAVTYTDALPDLIATLDNLKTTTNTVNSRAAALATFLTVGNTTTQALTSFFNANGSRLIQVSSTSKPVLSLLAEFAPEYACVLANTATLQSRANAAMSGGSVKVNAYNTQAMGRYLANETPKFTSSSPNCGTAGALLADGAAQFGGTGSGAQVKPSNPSDPNDACAGVSNCYEGNSLNATALSTASAVERPLVTSLIAGEYGGDPVDVPAVATLLATPILQGTTVEVGAK